jgi:hypothetical protein
MATFTIKTREHGDKAFFVPDNGGYVRLEQGRNHGTLGTQICDGGSFRGNTLTADAGTLSVVARKWWKQYLKNERTL